MKHRSDEYPINNVWAKMAIWHEHHIRALPDGHPHREVHQRAASSLWERAEIEREKSAREALANREV